MCDINYKQILQEVKKQTTYLGMFIPSVDEFVEVELNFFLVTLTSEIFLQI